MPEIRTATQFNPIFRPIIQGAATPTWKVPPHAFPVVVPFNNDGVLNHNPAGGGIHEPLFSYRNNSDPFGPTVYLASGMDDCPQAIAPHFETISIRGYDYIADLTHNTFELLDVQSEIELPPTREFLGFEYGVNIPGNLNFPTLINIVARFIPRWQYTGGDNSIIEGKGSLFGISISSTTGIAIGAIETQPVKTGTEIASIAFGIPYPADGVCAVWDGKPVSGPDWVDAWLGANFWATFAGRVNPIGAARVGGVWRDVYPLRFENGILLHPIGPIAGGWPYERVPVGYEVVPNPADYNASIERNFENTPPFTAYYASLVNPTGGAFWNVWKGPKEQAKSGAIGYLIHRDTPQWGTEALNPPEGETWFLYDHSWSL